MAIKRKFFILNRDHTEDIDSYCKNIYESMTSSSGNNDFVGIVSDLKNHLEYHCFSDTIERVIQTFVLSTRYETDMLVHDGVNIYRAKRNTRNQPLTNTSRWEYVRPLVLPDDLEYQGYLIIGDSTKIGTTTIDTINGEKVIDVPNTYQSFSVFTNCIDNRAEIRVENLSSTQFKLMAFDSETFTDDDVRIDGTVYPVNVQYVVVFGRDF